MKGRVPGLCVVCSGDETSLVSDDVGGAEVRDRVLRAYAGPGALYTAC